MLSLQMLMAKNLKHIKEVITSWHLLMPAGSSEDEETEARNQRKAKRKMTLASKKLEKDALDSKSKKTKVLIEVI